MNRNQIIGAVVGVVVVGGAGFYGGMTYAKAQTPVPGAGFTRGAGGTFAGRGAGGGGFMAGQIVSAGNGTITLQSMMSSSTEIVLVSASTQILKTVSGSMSDLTAGTQVVVTGTPNSDGSMTAQSIQVRPAGMGNGTIIRVSAPVQTQ